MNKGLSKIVVRVPTESVGETLGELNHRHSWLDDVSDENGVFTIQARVPSQEVVGFKKWLEKITNGKGEIVIL